MSRRRVSPWVVLFVASTALASGCATPSTPSEVTKSRPASLEVMGPDWLEPGRSAQFAARIRHADGTTTSVTTLPNLRWSTSNLSLMSVSDSGMVTASESGPGEAVITAEIVISGITVNSGDAVQGTRKVAIRPRAVVKAELDVSLQGTAGRMSYVLALKLTESAGVPVTVTSIYIGFDDNSAWGSPGCDLVADRLGQSRVPAGGTLTLDPIACGDPDYTPYNVVVDIAGKDDNDFPIRVVVVRQPVIR